MKKTNRRFLAYAVAIAASFAAVPGITQAEPVEAPQAEASVDNGTVGQETTAPAAEAEAKAAQEAARKKAEAEAKEARERAREAENARQEAARRERSEARSNAELSAGR